MAKFNQCPNCDREPSKGFFGGGFSIFMNARTAEPFTVISAEISVATLAARKAELRLVNVGEERRIKL